MNSEELEQSLRTEFESYLKNMLADVRQEVSEFQKQFEAEFEKHKSQIDEVFQSFSARIATDKELDAGFSESVVEHLRLSRDEGARITATAFAEAEEFEKQNALETTAAASGPAVSYSELRDAINDISTKTTQSAILKTLVHHAAQFTPRGAFFIIKNEHLVGWRVFGKEGEVADESTVREVFFPVASSTILGAAVRSLSAIASNYGTYSDDSIYLNKLNFQTPENMFAVPLVVRGRTVAALYADNGNEGGEVSIEAIETMVRVAGLTVEVLASARGSHAEESAVAEAPVAESKVAAVAPVAVEAAPVAETVAEPVEEPVQEYVEPAPVSEPVAAFDNSYSYEAPVAESFDYKPIEQPAEAFEDVNSAPVEGDSFSFRTPSDDKFPTEFSTETAAAFEEPAPTWDAAPATEDYYATEATPEFETTTYEIPETAAPETDYAATLSSNDYQFETTTSYEIPQTDFEAPAATFETPAFEANNYQAESFAPATSTSFEPVAVETGKAETAVAEAPVEAEVKAPTKSRFSERNVDLPIEVSEDERRLHNDARRFARLLVSEIKLYNEQKVKEGRDSSDLYDRLREAIDRSREMYDKRVQPPVAAKFDYFHYEIVSSLAEGDESRLGGSYPGATV